MLGIVSGRSAVRSTALLNRDPSLCAVALRC
jgi:hypothetical protein